MALGLYLHRTGVSVAKQEYPPTEGQSLLAGVLLFSIAKVTKNYIKT